VNQKGSCLKNAREQPLPKFEKCKLAVWAAAPTIRQACRNLIYLLLKRIKSTILRMTKLPQLPRTVFRKFREYFSSSLATHWRAGIIVWRGEKMNSQRTETLSISPKPPTPRSHT
jgi:hypothetical protein